MEEAVFMHERQSLKHLIHDIPDHRLGEKFVPMLYIIMPVKKKIYPLNNNVLTILPYLSFINW